MNTDTSNVEAKEEVVGVYDIRPLTVRFDKSKSTWLILRGSCPIKYHKGTKQEAQQIKDELQRWPRVLNKFFILLKPTVSARQRKLDAMARAEEVIERGLR